MPPRKKSGKKKGARKGSVQKPEEKAVEKKEEKKEEKMDTSEDKVAEIMGEKKEKKEEEELLDKIDPKAATRADIKSAVLLILQAVENKELGLFTRVTRNINPIRKKLTPGLLHWATSNYCPELQASLEHYADEIKAEKEEDKKLVAENVEIAAKRKKAADLKKAAAAAAEKEVKSALDGTKTKEEEKAAKEKEEKDAKEAKEKEKEKEKTKEKLLEEATKEKDAAKLPETRALLHLFIGLLAIDRGAKEEAASSLQALLEYIHTFNRRTMDPLSAKVYYFYTLTQETLGNLESIRNDLLRYHRTAALQHNEPGQAALVVSILRSFLHFKLYQQADKFRLNTTLPESRNNDVFARYLYYIGQINAVQLQYSDAFNHLTQAVRKAPQTGAYGFRQAANKLLIIVQLLMGEIPERSIFITGDLVVSLKPYFQLTQTVRVGDLAAFEAAVKTHAPVWEKDGLTSLIGRLRNNVIKTGLRKLNLSYSRISLSEIREKLNLESDEDAEFIVSKCIHDGVIDAVIDHENKFMFSKVAADKYATHGPQAMYHKRIMFCMEIHNDAVKALRFPPNAHKTVLEAPLEEEDVELEADSMDDE